MYRYSKCKERSVNGLKKYKLWEVSHKKHTSSDTFKMH